MRVGRLICILLLPGLLFSCSKEESLEMGGNPTTPGGALGNDCIVNAIIAADSLTGRGLFSMYTSFNFSSQATRVEAYDSISLSLESAADLTYKGDTIRVGQNEYFVTDALKRISRYYTLADPSDPSSDTYIYNYTYDAAGYLKEKTISVIALPFPLVKFVYTWTGGNLVQIEGNTAVPGFIQKVLTAEMTYDASKTARNFLPLMPDGFETFLYIMAVDIGKKSTNVLRTVRMTTYDENGAPADIYNTLIRDVKFSTDGYITEWFAEGNGVDVMGIFTGRTMFSYRCN